MKFGRKGGVTLVSGAVRVAYSYGHSKNYETSATTVHKKKKKKKRKNIGSQKIKAVKKKEACRNIIKPVLPVKAPINHDLLKSQQKMAKQDVRVFVNQLKVSNSYHYNLKSMRNLLVVEGSDGLKAQVPINDVKTVKNKIFDIYAKYKKIFDRENIRWRNFAHYSSFTFVMLNGVITFRIYNNYSGFDKRKKHKKKSQSKKNRVVNNSLKKKNKKKRELEYKVRKKRKSH